MKKTKMLKKNYEFRKVLSKGMYFSGNYIQAAILKNRDSSNYLGLAVNTKSGKAFQRNRIKRLLRENYKIQEEELKDGYSIVFLIKKKTEISKLNFQDIKKDMEMIITKSRIYNES